MDNLKKLLEDLQSVISKYRYIPVETGGMLRYTQNKDEIVIFIPYRLSTDSLTEPTKFKSILIIYERN
jgi:hypothetical protein